jgi:DNA adenine methylase
MLSHLLPLINPAPGEHVYVEPFGGSGVVMLNKLPHASETYNDTDGELVNLFRIIRDPDGVVHLWWELINTPVSREEFALAIDPSKRFSPENPVLRAAKFVIRCR